MYEIIVDNFAGGGGASTGIEMAIGRSVDIAINHDSAAIAMHKANHPDTKHYCESVWEVDPVEACGGHPVALAWFSPDCKHFSKAKGGKPVDKNVRGLAWVAVKWAKKVRPRVIMLENVEEFKTWGPLIENSEGDFYPDPNRKGETFNLFINALKKFGYEVDFRELRACDFGAPTIRKRFFMIARCDGQPIVWPEPTHAAPERLEVQSGLMKPWRTAAEIIDWSIPCPSIFDRKKPLAENTEKRIAKGIQKFVIGNPTPFIVEVNHSGEGFRGQELDEPMHTITAKHGFGLVTPTIMVNEFNNVGSSLEKPLHTILTGNHHYLVAPVVSQIGQTGGGDRLKDINSPLSTIVTKQEHLLVAPLLTSYHSETTKDEVRAISVEGPIHTLDTSNRFGLVAAFISKYYGGFYDGAGSEMTDPVATITTKDHHAVVTAYVAQHYKTSIGNKANEPLGAITTVNKASLVTAFLLKYYGSDIGQAIEDPLHTVTTKDRFGLVTIEGQDYQIVDIGMRMLKPHELFAAQGFPQEYIIDKDDKGNSYPITAQVARCGNSVPPPLPDALVRVNLPELCCEKSRYSEVV